MHSEVECKVDYNTLDKQKKLRDVLLLFGYRILLIMQNQQSKALKKVLKKLKSC